MSKQEKKEIDQELAEYYSVDTVEKLCDWIQKHLPEIAVLVKGKAFYLDEIRSEERLGHILKFIKEGIVPFTFTICESIIDDAIESNSSRIMLGLKPRILKYQTEIKEEAIIAGLGQ